MGLNARAKGMAIFQKVVITIRIAHQRSIAFFASPRNLHANMPNVQDPAVASFLPEKSEEGY
jgi:hypothetical protein